MRSIFSIIAIVWGSLASGQIDVNQLDSEGEKQGHWEKKYKNGKLKYSGQFKNDLPAGKFERYSNKGKLSSTLFYTPGNEVVNAQLFHSNGQVLAKGNYINQKKDSLWTFYRKDGLLFSEGLYLNGELNGDYKEFYKNGKLHFHKNYKNGVEHGSLKEFYENGNVRSKKTYVNGLPEGAFVSYYTNGVYKVMGKYSNGRKQGTWKFYTTKLKIEKEERYQGGSLIYTTDEIITYWNDSLKTVRSREKYDKDGRSYFKAYHENGNIYREGFFFNGKKDSTWNYFSEAGRLDTIRTFYLGKRNGHWTTFHPNGKPKMEQSWHVNELVGKYEEYYLSGQIKVSGGYTNGQMSGGWKYFDEKGTLVKTKTHGEP